MRSAGVTADDIDLIVMGTTTPDDTFPAAATQVQRRIGMTRGAAFDVQAVCSGFVFALNVADNFIKVGQAETVLLIGAETMSRLLDWNDRTTCVLFGDGAGAVVLEASDKPGILATAAHADGSHHGILSVPGSVCGGKVTGDPFLRMDGQAVFKFAVRVLADVAKECCTAAAIASSELDWLIPHQANIRIIEATARRMQLPMERVVVTVQDHGNTSAASIPLALSVGKARGQIKEGDLLVTEAIGGGLAWGSVVLRW